jgi:hypothetical protein
VGLRVGLDAVEKKKILHCWKSNLGRPAHGLLRYRLSYPNSFKIILISGIGTEASFDYYAKESMSGEGYRCQLTISLGLKSASVIFKFPESFTGR